VEGTIGSMRQPRGRIPVPGAVMAGCGGHFRSEHVRFGATKTCWFVFAASRPIALHIRVHIREAGDRDGEGLWPAGHGLADANLSVRLDLDGLQLTASSGFRGARDRGDLLSMNHPLVNGSGLGLGISPGLRLRLWPDPQSGSVSDRVERLPSKAAGGAAGARPMRPNAPLDLKTT